ncbi:Crp/Fnr family transcriptional regulator [soil metagenome]
MATIGQSPNGLLNSLSMADRELLRPHLKPVDLRFGEALSMPGDDVKLVHFPNSGIVSKIVQLREGEAVEVGIVGRDGVVGACAALQRAPSPTAAIVRYPGTALVIDAVQFRGAVAQSASLREQLMQFQSIYCSRVERTAACNASHNVEERLCSRLLQSRALSGSDSLPLTQDLMAQMLAVQRNTISLVAHALQHAGIIRYSRGVLKINDAAALDRRSCGCHAFDQAEETMECEAFAEPRPHVAAEGRREKMISAQAFVDHQSARDRQLPQGARDEAPWRMVHGSPRR